MVDVLWGTRNGRIGHLRFVHSRSQFFEQIAIPPRGVSFRRTRARTNHLCNNCTMEYFGQLIVFSLFCLVPFPARTAAQTSQIVKYVRDLQVKQTDSRSGQERSTLFAQRKAQGFIDAGSLVSFTENLSDQDIADVLNSTLLAQLAADHKFNRQEQIEEWNKFYIEVLQNVGWVMQSLDFKEYKSASSKFALNDVVLQLLGTIASKSELVVMESAMKTLKNLPSTDDSVVVFNTESYKNRIGNFQILPCNKDSSGQIVLGVGAFHFTSKIDVTRFLFWEFDSSAVDLFYGIQSITLNEQIYAKVRDEVAEKVAPKVKQFVHNLPI